MRCMREKGNGTNGRQWERKRRRGRLNDVGTASDGLDADGGISDDHDCVLASAI